MKYRSTLTACYLGYMVQAIVNTFVPLLLLTFQKEYGITTGQMTLLITLNFLIQLLTDLCSPLFADRIGYRASAILAHGLTAAGLAGLTFLPGLLGRPFEGLIVCVVLYAVGGGLLEVLISPIIEALPLPNKEKRMSLLHSFYCWGQVAVVLLSTAFFALFGTEHWRTLALFWAALAGSNILLFAGCPIVPLLAEGQAGDSLGTLAKKPVFWLAMVMMVGSGASNNAVSQWLSTFLEGTLGVPKAVGDIAGPCGFAALMGASRVLYSRFSTHLKLGRAMALSCAGCVAAYFLIALSTTPAVCLAGCLLCGFSVGLLWPGTFSLASAAMERGGTLLFALLALAGDLGCASGPALVGWVTERTGDMSLGLLAGCLFPLTALLGSFALSEGKKKTPNQK